MSEAAFAVLTLLVLAWAVTSDLLARVNINGPMVFTVAGYVLANPDWGSLSVDFETPSIHLIAELTLALLLFSDAARVNLASLRRDLAFPARLLASVCPCRCSWAPCSPRGSSTTCRGPWPASSARRWPRRTPP